MLIWDEDASSWKYVTIDNLQDEIDTTGGGGISWDGSTANGVATYKDGDEATVESNLTFDGSTLVVAGNIKVNQYIEHNEDDNTYIRFRADQQDFVAGGKTMLTLDETDSQDILIVNTNGADVDFRVEGDTDTHLLFCDAGLEKVAIGASVPVTKLTVEGAVTLKEQAAADSDTAAYGQLWVKSETPNELYFTTDAGDDIQITDGTSLAGGGGGGSGDITGVTLAGDSGTAEDLTANVNLTIAGGDGITTSGSSTTMTLNLDAALTTVTSLLATDIVIGEDSDTKIDFETADEIHFDTAGSERMQIDASGKVGIGTTAPSTKLTVAGTVSATDPSGSDYGTSDHWTYVAANSAGKVNYTTKDLYTSISTDSSYNDVVLLLHCEEGDDDTDTKDDSARHHTLSAFSGGAVVSTDQYKYGTASLYFAAASDHMIFPESADWQFPGDFTWEFWMRVPGTVDTGRRMMGYGGTVHVTAGNYTHQFHIGADNYVYFYYGTSGTWDLASTTEVTANTWFHVAVSRTGSTLRLFLNGTQEDSVTYSGVIGHENENLWVGGNEKDSDGFGGGYLDEIRITKGTGRYTSNFTPAVHSGESIYQQTVVTSITGVATDDTNTTYTAGNGLLLTSTTFTLDDPANGTTIDESTIATDDRMLVWDEDASSWKYVTIDNLQDEIDTGGSSEWAASESVIYPSTATDVVIGGDGTSNADIVFSSDGSAVFNEQSASVDFRVESNGNANMLFVDGSADAVGIGTSAPTAELTVGGEVSASGGFSSAVKPITTLTSNGVVTYDITDPALQTVILKANQTNTYLGTETLPIGKTITIRLSANGGDRTLAWHTSMKFVGEKPASIAQDKIALLSVTTFGTLCGANGVDTDVVCAYAVED
jgi:prepilin-type processing-associated H-X9-DG protein